MPRDYELVYLMSNTATTYAVYLFFKIFFEKRITTKKIEICSYVGMYLITSALFINDFVPKIIIIANIALLLSLTYNYEGGLLQKIISSLLTYIIFWAVEILVVLLTSNVELSLYNNTNYSSTLGLVIIPLVCILLANVLKNLKNLKKGENIPIMYWILSIIIPVSTIYISNIVFMSDKIMRIEMVVYMIWIFAINIGIIIIYDILKSLMESRIQNVYSAEKAKYYKNEIFLMEKSNESIKKIKHDLKNHIYAIKILANDNKLDEINNYLQRLELKMAKEIKIVNTDNTIIDGILNYKLQEAVIDGIEIDTRLNIPKNLNINDTEMTIVLGNLLDNAIEAVAKKDVLDKQIKVIGMLKEEKLVITIKNQFSGELNQENMQTTKKEKKIME